MTEPAPPPPPQHASPAPDRAPPEPSGTDAFFLTIVDVLRSGPLTAFGLERAIERSWPRFLRGRRGYVHPALLHLQRHGAVTAQWADTPHGRRRVYALPHEMIDGGEIAASDAGSGPVDVAPELARVAERIARGLRFAPGLQHAVRRDVTHHLRDAVATLCSTGVHESAALKEVVSDFGDPWRIRTDMKRIAHGRRAVLFPSNLRETLTGLAIYDAGILLCIVGAIVFIRLQVFSAYHIPTRSMEPTLHGDRNDGDRILVNRLSPPPARFGIHVFDGWGSERKNYVKRCVGLPNETLRLREGDLYVGGDLVRKYGAAYEALLFPLYGWDDVVRRARTEYEGDLGAAREQVFDEQFELWENVSGKWVLDTGRGYHAEAPADDERAVLRWRDTIHDDLYDAESGEVEGGSYTCPDVRLTADVVLDSEATEVVLHLTRGAAAFDAIVTHDRIELRVEDEPVLVLDDADVPVGETVRIRFAQVDLVLRVDVGDREIVHELPQPEYPKRSAPHAQVDLRVRGDGAWVKPVAIERDVFYTPDYDEDEVQLGPDDYYMLGDNSGNSQDSRKNGAVHRSRLVGKPILIVWPPKRWRIPR